MRQWTIVCVGILVMAGLSQAVVIDSFDALGTNLMYTTTTPAIGQMVNNVAGGAGWSGLNPVAGNGLGVVLPEARQTYCMMRSGTTFNMGDSLDVWVEPGNFGGGGVAVEFDDGLGGSGYYVVALGNQGNNHALIVKTFDGFSNGGSPIAYTNAGQIAGHTAKYQGAAINPDGQWYHVIAAINTVGADVVVDVTVNSGTPGSETQVDGTQFVDLGMAATTTLSNIGLVVSEWSSMGPDFDELSFVPEPATLVLLGLGGAVALLRRRR